ncbi:MAG: tRNA lysidine(34) synthetase TilS [Chloroflexi bacterium]|nr:tRNA lysidine(34) synthetase TilS [Chloroflexota bacterium]
MSGNDLLTLTRRSLAEVGLVRPGQLLVVAVSGGPDSVALLHALRQLAPERGFSLHVAHLNHQLRGEESNEDARFVAELADAWGLPVTTETADVLAYRRQRGLSLEAAARALRYSFLGRLVARLGAVGVTVGHTADDQVETVLLHLVRGSGLAGLRGMPVVQRLSLPRGDALAGTSGSLVILRPLLSVTRPEVDAYLRQHGLAFREDISNSDLALARNRVRHRVLPELELLNPAFRQTLVRTARLLRDDHEALERAAELAWPGLAGVGQGEVSLVLAGLVAQPIALQRLLVRRAVTELAGDLLDLDARHVDAALRLAVTGRTGAVVCLPEGLRAVRGYGTITLRLGLPEARSMPEEPVALRLPGMTSVQGWQVVARLVERPCQESRGALHADLDLTRLGGAVVVRRRQPGDRLCLGRGGGSKKLQDIFVDNKVPRERRDAVPVVAGLHGAVWAVGQALDQAARASAETSHVLCLVFWEGETT